MIDQTVAIGDVRVTPVEESELWLSLPRLLPDTGDPHALLEEHRDWIQPTLNERRHIRLPVWCYLVRTPERTILVDAGVGNAKPRPEVLNGQVDMLDGPFLGDLDEAGAAPESIDIVVSTHMHFDHVGWYTRLVDGAWAPTFPRARYLFVEPEWAHWSTLDDPSRLDSTQPVYDAGRAELIGPNERIAPEVALEHTPGHTPGHVSVRIESGGEAGVITGDLFHHKLMLVAAGERDRSDLDAALGIEARRSFLARYADRDVTVFGTHFERPAAGRLRSLGGSYRFEALDAGA